MQEICTLACERYAAGDKVKSIHYKTFWNANIELYFKQGYQILQISSLMHPTPRINWNHENAHIFNRSTQKIFLTKF